MASVLALGVNIVGWYACNTAFNIFNKKALTAWDMPWIVAWLQLLVGVCYIIPVWTLRLRKAPKVDLFLIKKFIPIGALHATGHASQVAAMGSGSVFMVNVVKAMEPIVGTAVSFLGTGKVAGWKSNGSLLPIVAGVCFAALKPGQAVDPFEELKSFASKAAFGSTVVMAVAKLLAKMLMTPKMAEDRNLDAGNNYALLTCFSCAALAGPALVLQGKQALDNPPDFDTLVLVFLSGAFYYASNEFSFRVLDQLGAVPQAVANAAKRVFVLAASVVFLGEAVTPRKFQGSAVALAGVLAYSLASGAEKKAPKKEKAK
ncbi:triose-phosphate transporter family-domain-containing protein [Pelagophyceae sp. CCMP2097]|nr:triose-phosphate transporter family-domain-containing protein [Pelagophyceae sp. CCMP2097]|mmetsp:Transcript_31368/g.105647  ORF Transcript_31368/g.105647 Transcript_31368/m.105647 type:complete len:316 (-) Transcript_31368:141-1088(-)